MNILITGGKSAAALKLLKAFAHDTVLLADYGEMPSFSSTAYQMVSLGDRNDDITAHNLLNTCLDHGVDAVLPLHAFEIEAVSKSIVLFEEFGIQVFLPELSELPKYLSVSRPTASWVLYQQGTVLFPLDAPEGHKTIGNDQKLNGVFYITEAAGTPEVTLFTIG